MSGSSAASGGLQTSVDLYKGTDTLKDLEDPMRVGLIVVSALGLLSFISSLGLFTFLCARLITWKRHGSFSYNQFVILIMNLLFADMQQSAAFLISLNWVLKDSIQVGSSACSAQGWLVGSGDLASGCWCLFIGVHTIYTGVLGRRIKPAYFYALIVLVWCFIYGNNFVQLALHSGTDPYVRAGAWCWLSPERKALRFYTHYLWIFVVELGVIIVYGAGFVLLHVRIRHGYYRRLDQIKHAKDVAKLMAFYPVIYVICTLPLATARTAAMTGVDVPIIYMIIAGAMITSNGWMDVLLYSVTRRILIFSDAPPPENVNLFETFSVPWGSRSSSRFGTTTTITSAGDQGSTPTRSMETRPVWQRPAQRFGFFQDKQEVGLGARKFTTADDFAQAHGFASRHELYAPLSLGGYSGFSRRMSTRIKALNKRLSRNLDTETATAAATEVLDTGITGATVPGSETTATIPTSTVYSPGFPPRRSSLVRAVKNGARRLSVEVKRLSDHLPRHETDGYEELVDDPSMVSKVPEVDEEQYMVSPLASPIASPIEAISPGTGIHIMPQVHQPRVNVMQPNFSHPARNRNMNIASAPEPFPLGPLPSTRSARAMRLAANHGHRETTITVKTEPAQLEDLMEMEALKKRAAIQRQNNGVQERTHNHDLTFLSRPNWVADSDGEDFRKKA